MRLILRLFGATVAVLVLLLGFLIVTRFGSIDWVPHVLSPVRFRVVDDASGRPLAGIRVMRHTLESGPNVLLFLLPVPEFGFGLARASSDETDDEGEVELGRRLIAMTLWERIGAEYFLINANFRTGPERYGGFTGIGPAWATDGNLELLTKDFSGVILVADHGSRLEAVPQRVGAIRIDRLAEEDPVLIRLSRPSQEK